MKEVNPKDTKRAQAFEMWMKSPMPMVTVVKTFDVTRLYKESKRPGKKFNMLLCWCIGRAGSQVEECYLLPKDGRLYQYDRLGINVIVDNAEGGISSCDVPYSDDLKQFSLDYETRTREVAQTCKEIAEPDAMIIGTSAVVGTELDCIVNQYTGIFNNPFLVWGRYRRHWFKTTLTISFQFHHAQLDGREAARFLNALQTAMNEI